MQRKLGRRDDEPPLAHSGDRPGENRRVHDYPDGERHEGLSVELMRRIGVHGHRAQNSRDLIEHLVASHHGWARPFIQPAQGTAILVETLDSAVGERVTHDEAARAPTRFLRLQERYGWLGLAWLEAVFRLADQSATAAGTMHDVDTGKWMAGLRRQVKPTEAANGWSKHVVELATLAGNTPGDYLAAIGVLHALSLRHPDCRLGWRGTTPVIYGNIGEEEIAGYVAGVRGEFSVDWPNDLNRLPEGDIRRLLARTQQQPSRALGHCDAECSGSVADGLRQQWTWRVPQHRNGYDEHDRWSGAQTAERGTAKADPVRKTVSTQTRGQERGKRVVPLGAAGDAGGAAPAKRNRRRTNRTLDRMPEPDGRGGAYDVTPARAEMVAGEHRDARREYVPVAAVGKAAGTGTR